MGRLGWGGVQGLGGGAEKEHGEDKINREIGHRNLVKDEDSKLRLFSPPVS